MYAYLKEDGNDYAVQAQTLEKSVEKARATNRELPPGFRAHLGMLYLKMGDGEKGVEQLQGEKQAFPESTPFMDFLMRNAGKSAAAPQAQAATPAAESVARNEPGAKSEPAAQTEPAAPKKKGTDHDEITAPGHAGHRRPARRLRRPAAQRGLHRVP